MQCWFKLFGQNLKLQTRFSQFELRLDKKWREQKVLKISPELVRNFQPKFYPKIGHFGFFQIIKNYAEITLLIDMKSISQEASYSAQQSLRSVESPKTCANSLKFVFKQKFWVLHIFSSTSFARFNPIRTLLGCVRGFLWDIFLIN